MDLEAKVALAHELCDRIMHFASAMRSHQVENLRMVREIATRIGGGAGPYLTAPGFLVEEIVPGGGKSFNAVVAASVLVGSGLFDVAFWISPRLTLIQQAKEDFSDTSLAMRLFGKKIPIFNPADLIPEGLPSQYQSLLKTLAPTYVLSFQRIVTPGVSAVLQAVAESKRVLLIFDEFQLLRELPEGREDEEKDWYGRIKPLVETCLARTGFGGIILSGGLYRNKGSDLPIVRYRQGDLSLGEDPKRRYAMSDVRYTLSEAQEDQCITKIDVDFYDGEINFSIDGKEDLENVSGITDEFYNSKLVHFLEVPDVWQSIITDMLTSLDYYNPPGGYHQDYMVMSKSIKDAEIHAQFLEQIGRKPLLIHSRQSDAEKKRLDEFRRGNGPWDGLVSVAMGYIGLSIPRLSHMAYLSHYRSLAWINQAFHRVTRTDYHRRAPTYEHQLARIFVPNDPQMRELVALFMADQNPGVAKRPLPPGPDVDPPWPPPPPPPKDRFEGLGATLSGRQFSTDGENCTENDFISDALLVMPQLNALTRKVVEDFARFRDEYRR